MNYQYIFCQIDILEKIIKCGWNITKMEEKNIHVKVLKKHTKSPSIHAETLPGNMDANISYKISNIERIIYIVVNYAKNYL